MTTPSKKPLHDARERWNVGDLEYAVAGILDHLEILVEEWEALEKCVTTFGGQQRRAASEALRKLNAASALRSAGRGKGAVGCNDCGRKYGDEYGFPDLVIPDDAWQRISPKGNEGGLLCPSCICKRLYDAGIETRGAFRSGPLCEPDPQSPEPSPPEAETDEDGAREMRGAWLGHKLTKNEWEADGVNRGRWIRAFRFAKAIGAEEERSHLEPTLRFAGTVNDDLRQKLSEAEAQRDEALKWSDDDQPIPEDVAIDAAHPVRSGAHATYQEAMRMVGAKRSKGALVDLVTWLLVRAEKAESARDAAGRKLANLPNVGEPEPAVERGALVWEQGWEEDTIEGRITGVGLNPQSGRPLAIQMPADGLEVEEARWLAAALLAAAERAEFLRPAKGGNDG